MFNIFSMCFGRKSSNDYLPVYTEITQEMNYDYHNCKCNNYDNSNDNSNANSNSNNYGNSKCNCDGNGEIQDILKEIKQIKIMLNTNKSDDIKTEDWYRENIKQLINQQNDCYTKIEQFNNICDVYELSIEYLKTHFNKKFYNITHKKINELIEDCCNNEQIIKLISYKKQIKKIYNTKLIQKEKF